MTLGRSNRSSRRKGERGVALILAAIWLTAMVAISAIAIEVSRLTDTATETQIAADAAALGAAQRLISGGTQSDATTSGQTVAAANQTDGRAPAAGDVTIEFGSYAAGAFVPGGTTNKAVRATVLTPNVRYILASALNFGATTSVTKSAVAMYSCTSGGAPTIPLTIGACMLATFTQGQACSSGPQPPLTVVPSPTDNACWTATPSEAPDWFPPECGGTGNGPQLSIGSDITPRNGNMTPIYRGLQACVDAGIHDFLMPIIPCPVNNCNGGTSIGQVVGFATIRINSSADIQPNGQNQHITFSQICNNDAEGTSGGGGGSGSAQCFGSGNARLVNG